MRQHNEHIYGNELFSLLKSFIEQRLNMNSLKGIKNKIISSDPSFSGLPLTN